MSGTDPIRASLMAAIERRDADAFELALTAAFRAGLSPTWSDLLAEALAMPWHQRHEDVVAALQDLKDPRSVEALFEAALVQHEYLAYDEFHGLARKCTWALADIGTPEAKDRLVRLTRCENATIARYAQRRLDEWNAELGRKGF